MPAATTKKKSSRMEMDDPESPSIDDRAASGLKAVEHIQKALAGGKIRKAFSLWRASSHLRTAAAGTGGIVQRHPLVAALVGGTLAAGAIYYMATSMAGAEAGAEASEESDDETSDEQQDEDDQPHAEGATEEDDSEEDGADEEDADEDDAEPERSKPRAKRA